jgi:uncharacterized Zn-binding protein involved in type VI secretion
VADEVKDPQQPPKKKGLPGEKDGEFKLEPSGEGKRELESPKKAEKSVGNRAAEPAEPAKGAAPAPPKSPVKKGKEVSLGPVYKKTFLEDEVYTSKENDDDQSFVTALEGKVSVEVASASYNIDEKKAKLTVVKASAKGTVAHGQFDLVQWLSDALFGEDPKPKPPPDKPPPPMAARVGDVTVHGSPLVPGPGSPNVLIGGRPAWRAAVDLHLCPFPGAPHGSGPTLAGAVTVLINGSPAARAGDYVVEPTGGPDVILSGCATVLIGPGAPPPPPPTPVEKKAEDLPWVKFESVVSADVGQAGAEANLGAEFDASTGKGSAEAQLGAMAAGAKAEVPLKVRIRIPYTTYYLGLGVKVEGTLASAGAEAGAGIKYDQYGMKPFEATAGAKAGVGLGGVGVKFGVDVAK